MATVAILWWLVGGRAFCAWTCPYHLLSEWVEILHLKLAEKGWAKDYQLDRRLRPVLWFVFAALSFGTGYMVFEWISPVGITSRAIIYGTLAGMSWVGVLLLIELFFSRRMWCRYMCPIGLTYAALGATAPTVVHYDLEKCLHEGECRKVCLVPHVLDITIKGRATKDHIDIGADCTRCAMCIEACPTGALSFRIKGLDKLL
jgi:ferredoxin-type protein NapH